MKQPAQYRPAAADSKRNRRLPGEQSIPTYTPSIAARSIDGHLLRNGTDVFAWYRLSPQRWSFRSDSQRQDLVAAIAGQYAELHGRWLHLRVTTRPYPIRMWAEAHVHNAVNRLPDSQGALSFDDYLIGEQQQLLGRSMAEKEVYLGVQVQTRNMVDRAVERAAPLLRKIFPAAVDAELLAIDSEVEHLDQVIASAGLEGRPVTAEEMSWLMHRSCSLGLPAPRNLPAVPGAAWEPEDLASFTDAADFHQEPYAPTVTVRGRTGSNAGMTRHVAVLTVGQMHGLQIPEIDDPWMQHSDRLAASVEWSARIYVRRPEEVSGELARQMNKVRSQVRHYTDEHELEPPQSLARQASRVLEIDDEMTSGFTALATRVRSWWRLSVSGPTERDALRLAQQLLELYKPKVAIEHPEAQYALAREFIPGEPLASGAYMRRGSVVWAAAAVPTATAEVGDRRGILLGETCTATRRPVAWDPWMAQEIRDGSGLTAMVAGLVLGVFMTRWTTSARIGMDRFSGDMFGVTGVAPAAWFLLVFALGAASGAVLRRMLPAMAVTIVVFAALMVGAYLARGHYATPSLALSSDHKALPTDALVADHGVRNAAGDEISWDDARSLCVGSEAVSCMRDRGYVEQYTRYHAASQYWRFQWTETGLLVLITLGLTGVTAYRVLRRPL